MIRQSPSQRAQLEFVAEKQPALKAKKPNDFIDSRFVRKLEEELLKSFGEVDRRLRSCFG